MLCKENFIRLQPIKSTMKIIYLFTDLCYKTCIFNVTAVKKHTGNTFPKKLILISKNKIKGKSKCVIFLTDLESELKTYLQFFVD